MPPSFRQTRTGHGCAAATALSLLLLLPVSAQADPPPALQAEMHCRVEGSAVVCHVDANPSVLTHITYARADVVQSPPFLKVVVGSVDYSESRDRKPRLNLAFVAKKAGSGDVIVKVQAMVCADDGSSCPSLSRALTTRVNVGP